MITLLVIRRRDYNYNMTGTIATYLLDDKPASACLPWLAANINEVIQFLDKMHKILKETSR